MTTTAEGQNSKPPAPPAPHIGAFVLETLTLGMYGEPRHTLREYVQNSFDSIRAATRTKLLSGRGAVTVSLNGDSITIRDNGLGVPAAQAWNTLTSIGASKKDRERDAGFRGIGRLAGMAYCEELAFKTSFPGEKTITTITFDCKRLMSAMSPDEGGDVELGPLLAGAITQSVDPNGTMPDDHFFEVVMKGLAHAPENLKDTQKVIEYLQETAPVTFSPNWQRTPSIESEYKKYFGQALEFVDLFVKYEENEVQIFKPYGESYQHARGTVALRSIETLSGENNSFWAWIGYLDEPVAVTESTTRGLRVRVRNIQVGDTNIMEDLFAQVKPSYGRFSTVYVGEIHIDPAKVVPNARRDGFEETTDWLRIQKSLRAVVCAPLATEAYRASRESQIDVEKIIEEVNGLLERGTSLAESSKSTYDSVVALMNEAKRLRRRAAKGLKTVAELEEVAEDAGDDAILESKSHKEERLLEASKNVEIVESQAKMLIGRFLDQDDRIAGLRARLRQEVVQEVLDIVNAYVDPSTYQAIRKHLLRLNA
jgi:Histidine kinase-, DNA gyrase B-, and HSP90-like ATPase